MDRSEARANPPAHSTSLASQHEDAVDIAVPPDLHKAALALTPAQRTRLGNELLESARESLDEVKAAWAEELDRRLDAYERGELETESFEVVKARMDQFLESLQARQK